MTSRGWVPTHTLVRGIVLGVAGLLVGVLFRRPDLVVLATPFAVTAAWSLVRRPRTVPTATARLDHTALREGEATTWRIRTEAPPGADEVLVRLAPAAYTASDPDDGMRHAALVAGSPAALDIPVRTTRWGRRPWGPVAVFWTGPWNGFRYAAPPLPAIATQTLPLPAVYDSTTASPLPAGLVGTARSARPGDGSEFATIRPFQVGDRLRRIHWPVSVRTGRLHVTSTWADQDSEVVLLVDAGSDVGESEGIDGRASSLDLAVRAAGAVAEHYLRHGDRVALQVLGTDRGTLRVPSRSGRSHLRRVLDVLSTVDPAPEIRVRRLRTDPVPAGALVLLLSPMVTSQALDRAVELARRDLAVVVVDTLPPDVAAGSPLAALAWRIRLLERDQEIRTVLEQGVPVVPWRVPGSLDAVLRDVRRRTSAPRLVSR